MKRLFYLAFCLTVAMSLGCVALTYPNVTDNEGSGQFSVTTKSAHLEETTQTSQTSGSRRIEHVAFLDQDKNGDHRLVGYALELAVGTSEFHSDTFCNSNFSAGTGACAWLTHIYTPPGPCSFTAPGVSTDLNCLGDFSAIGLCFTSRPGECGDHDSGFVVSGGGDRFTSPFDKGELTALLAAGVEDSRGLLNYSVNQGNTQLVFDNGSQTFFPQIVGNYEIPLNLKKGFVEFNIGTPGHAQNLLALADMIDQGGQSNWTYTVTYNGVTRSGLVGFLDSNFYRNVASQL